MGVLKAKAAAFAILALCTVPTAAKCTYPDLLSATATELQDGLQAGCFSSVDLVNAYVKRNEEVNSTVRAVVEINPDAWDIARELDDERSNGIIRGPLHGLPILIKNNIATDDKMQTNAGSYALMDAKPIFDSTMAAKLRKAGAIILGKTNLSQWANYRSSNSSNGWSAWGGQVIAAHVPNQDPSGSSSGSGVASDLGLAYACLSTETSGSITGPSEKSGLVGIKPTVGLTSRYLVIPISEHQDTIGPMTRTVEDAALVLQAIAGQDSHDNYTLAAPYKNRLPDYAKHCKKNGLKGKRIGIPRNVLEARYESSRAPYYAAFEAAVDVLRDAGATIVENANFTAYEGFMNDRSDTVMQADFISGLEDYLFNLKTNPHHVHNLKDVQAFTHRYALEEWPTRDTATWDESLAAGINNTSPEFWPEYQKNLYYGGEGGVFGAINRDRLDAVVLPTNLGYPVSAVVGGPVITVPMGVYPEDTPVERSSPWNLTSVAPGVPMGLGFMGLKWSEPTLIEMAYAYEQRTQVRSKLDHYIVPKTQLKRPACVNKAW
ncbi:amidase [Aspergillus egyptiacus]|nr:amidase [Aspergillus egyptiacus]